LTEAGIAVVVSVITRACAGPILPAASAAAVFGSLGGSRSPFSVRRGASATACATRVLASAAERCSIPARSRFVVRNPVVAAMARDSSSATASSITECSIREVDSMCRT
jgi:hypothetical protein